MMVPERPSMAVARVMMTRLTPASMAERAFSILGSIPPLIVPSALYFSKSSWVMTGITEHTFLLKREDEGHIVIWCESFGCL